MSAWLTLAAVCVLQFGGTALHDASRKGHLAVAQTLLGAGADVGAQNQVHECS